MIGDNRSSYIASLDGLRAISIALVVAYHITQWVPGGPFGVDVFFGISGYLITTLLLRERDHAGKVDLPAFYSRRARRILPALAVCILVTFAAGQASWFDALSALFAMNWAHAFQLTRGAGLGHTWTLALEEQFYTIWGVALWALRSDRGRVRVWVICSLALYCVVWFAVSGNARGLHLFLEGTGGTLSILLGCLVATLPPEPGPVRLGLARAWPLAFIGLMVVALISPDRLPLPAFADAFLAALSVWLLIAAIYPSRLPALVLGSTPLRWLGLRSYSLYLWHFPINWWIESFHPHSLPAPVMIVGKLAVFMVAAELSYRFIEQPFRRRRNRPVILAAPAET